MTETRPQLERDPDFYFSFRTFQVQDTLFRVPRHLFLMPNAADIQPKRQGTDNDDDVVVLGPDVQKDDFLQLVRSICPRKFNTPEVLSANEWQAVLDLSKKFGLEDARKKAVSNLKNVFFEGDPVEALLCAKENGLDDWVAPLIEKIVSTNRDLDDAEVEKLGVAMAMKIARAQGAADAKNTRKARGQPQESMFGEEYYEFAE